MSKYIDSLTKLYLQKENPENAFWMKKYMREQFDFFGIKKPERIDIYKKFFSENGLPNYEELSELLFELWYMDKRDYQYFAFEILAQLKKHWTEDIIYTLEKLITAKSWWDTVDWLATHSVGTYFLKFPENKIEITENWMQSGNMWLQRTCIIFQLKYKKDTDIELLFDYIKRCAYSKEFFIQKAIGWALRELSKTFPDLVIEFVENNELKPLSIREALKVINRKK